MTWIQRLLAQSLPDPPPRDPTNPFWWGVRGQTSASGVRVDADSALTISAVFAAVSVISSAIAGVPVTLFTQDPDGTKHVQITAPLWSTLNMVPNDAQTAFEWWEYLTGCALLRGNGYARILPGPSGWADQLDVPYSPDEITPKVDHIARRILKYERQLPDGSKQTILPDEMFHLKGMTRDGLVGISVVSHARETMGLALATEAYGARFFSQDATPKGVLTHPGTFKDDSPAPDRIRAEWQMMHSGLANAHNIAVLEEGMTFQAIGMSHEDSQFLATREFTVRDIARWFQIQPHMIQDLDHATFTNIEAQGEEFVRYTLRRWAARWEQTITRMLLPEGLKVQLDFDQLLRGDTLTRFQTYELARRMEIMNRNEVRAKENMNPTANGDDYSSPIMRRETIKEDLPVPTTPPQGTASLDELEITARSNGHAG